MDENNSALQQLIALGVIPDEQALMYKQMGLGAGMAQTPSAEGQSVGPYHVYTAASPLEHISNALARTIGMRQQKQAVQGLQNSFGRQTEGRLAYAKGLDSYQNEAIRQLQLAMGRQAGPGTPMYDASGIGTGGEF